MAEKKETKKFEIDDQFLAGLMDEVKKELDGLAKSEVAKLAKSEDEKSAEITASDDKSEGNEPANAPAPDLNGDGKIGNTDGKPDAPADESNGAELEAPGAVEADKELSKPLDEQTPGEISPSPSVEVLQAEYEELDDEDLHNHFLAAKAAICARMGMDEESAEAVEDMMAAPAPEASPMEASPMEASPMEASPAAPAPAPEAPPEMAKADPAMAKADLPPPVPPEPKEPLTPPATVPAPVMKNMKKSESELEIDALKATIAKQEEIMLQLVDKMHAPIRKSVKGISELAYVAKTEIKNSAPKLSREAAIAKLREKAHDRSLKKSDRDLINSYSMGNVSYNDIAHLLTEVK